MTQGKLTGIVVKIWPWVAGGLALSLLQGAVVFVVFGYVGSYLSLNGLWCVIAPLGVELVLAVIVLKNLDQLHSQSAANPHSLIGKGLRNDRTHAPTGTPAPPPTRAAWDGGFQDMDSAGHQMAKKDH